MTGSIRRRLLLRLMIVLGVCSALVGCAMFIHARGEMVELFDETIVQVAYALNTSVDGSIDAVAHESQSMSNEENFLLQIWEPSGDRLLYSSHPVIPFPLQQIEGIHTVTFENQKWRTLVLRGEEKTIQVAQQFTNAIAIKTALEFLVPVLLQIPLLSLLIWMVVGRSLQPLTKLSTEIQTRSPNSLQPLDLDKVPSEITPVIQALNELLQRLKEAMSRQRQFIADSAHELRTPLTALRLQMDNLNHAETEQEQAFARGELSKGIERSIHLANQLLVLFREDPKSNRTSQITVALTSILQNCLARSRPLALAKQIEVEVSQNEAYFILGHQESLEILFSNLLDNALRYTQDSGKVHISVLPARHGDLIVEVKDNGPGIPQAEMDHIFERFYRIPGTKQNGSGLGLAIVQAIAARHDATVSVHAGLDGQGATFRVLFPSSRLPMADSGKHPGASYQDAKSSVADPCYLLGDAEP